jgi:hypothetical protein
MIGIFRDNARTRLEFLDLIKRPGMATPLPSGAVLACIDE